MGKWSLMTRVANDSREVSMSKIPLHIKNSVTTTLHAMLGVTLESVEHYMLSTFFGHFNDLEVLLCT